MPIRSFHEWLRNREETPAAEKLALLIAGAGPAGVSPAGLSRALGLPPETLADLLKALTATGQVTVLKVNGRRTYRATT